MIAVSILDNSITHAHTYIIVVLEHLQEFPKHPPNPYFLER